MHYWRSKGGASLLGLYAQLNSRRNYSKMENLAQFE
jgi:hypothetical protein